MKVKCEKLAVFALAGMNVGGAFATTVVHDAGCDLVLNSASRAVYTNVYGGVWSYMRSSSWDGERTLLPTVRTRTDPNRKDSGNQPFVMERGLAKSANSAPCIMVNPTAVRDDNTFMRGAPFPTIPPGQLSCHPGEVADDGNQCVVMRFTMPRDGEYALIVKAWHQNVGKAGVALLVNGLMSARGRVVSQGSADGQDIHTNDFSIAAANYKAGDFVELAVDGDGTYNSNAMGLCFKVVETVEEVVDASDAFAQNASAPTPANPFTTVAGTWRGSCKYADTAKHEVDLVAGYVRTSQGGGLKGVGYRASAGAALSLPWIVVNASDDYVTEFSSGKVMYHEGRAIAPFEMVGHPDAAKFVSYQLTPTMSDRNKGGKPFCSVTLGPLLFAAAIPSVDENTPQKGVRIGWSLDSTKVLADAKVTRTAMPEVWSWQEDAPVKVTVVDADGQPLALIPYGCARLRVSMFPDAARPVAFEAVP